MDTKSILNPAAVHRIFLFSVGFSFFFFFSIIASYVAFQFYWWPSELLEMSFEKKPKQN